MVELAADPDARSTTSGSLDILHVTVHRTRKALTGAAPEVVVREALDEGIRLAARRAALPRVTVPDGMVGDAASAHRD